jgi:hypothetical protein
VFSLIFFLGLVTYYLRPPANITFCVVLCGLLIAPSWELSFSKSMCQLVAFHIDIIWTWQYKSLRGLHTHAVPPLFLRLWMTVHYISACSLSTPYQQIHIVTRLWIVHDHDLSLRPCLSTYSLARVQITNCIWKL